MNPSRIEQAIDEIYNYVEECKPSKLYPSKVVVDREQLYDLLDELRLCAPEEIKRYQKIITNRDGILNEAQQRAEDMLSQAQQQTAQILDQNEIVQTAYQRAEDIMRQATEEAERLVNAGIKAIWNFAHIDLQVPPDVVVENVHLSESLMRLSYRVCSLQDELERKAEKAAKTE